MELDNGWTDSAGVRTATLSGANACYAADWQSGALCVVYARRVRGGVQCQPIPAERVAALAAEPAGPPWVVALGAEESFSRWVDVPLRSYGKAIRVLPSALDVELPFPIEECVHGFLAVGRAAGNKTRALAVAARHAHIESALARWRGLGLDPAALDYEGLALWTQHLREAPADAKDADAPRILVSLAGERATVVFGLNGDYAGAFTANPPDAAALDRLLRARLRPKPAAVRWYWAGSGATDRAAIAGLTDALRGEWPGESVVHDAPDRFLVRALATRALLPGPLRCNLRVGRFTHPAIARQSRVRARRAAMGWILAGAGLCAANAMAVALAQGAVARSDREFEAARDRLLGYRLAVKGQKAVEAVEAAVRQRKSALEPFFRLRAPSLADRLADVAQTAAASKVAVEELSLTDAAIALSGSATRWDGWADLTALLERQGYRVRAKPGPFMVEGRLAFTLSSEGAP